MDASTKSFMHGLAAGLACLARDHDRPTMAADILGMLGVGIDDLEAAKTDPFDLDPLRECAPRPLRAPSPHEKENGR